MTKGHININERATWDKLRLGPIKTNSGPSKRHPSRSRIAAEPLSTKLDECRHDCCTRLQDAGSFITKLNNEALEFLRRAASRHAVHPHVLMSAMTHTPPSPNDDRTSRISSSGSVASCRTSYVKTTSNLPALQETVYAMRAMKMRRRLHAARHTACLHVAHDAGRTC